ncbi:hypothetical protein ANN_02305 [Periplaneta americana]|uniref:Uncharacterized protein n=1 Tax=Periplaneta americana TaxID=6978 RepID=A0ABQ8TYE3_PERAM|nr:hypothetical protein ANN_02305 [Periplaneta americana]
MGKACNTRMGESRNGYRAGVVSAEHHGALVAASGYLEEHILRVFENNVLRKIFGAKRDEVTGEWRKLHNAELHALYSLPDIIRNIKSRRLRWAGHVARMGESRNAPAESRVREKSRELTGSGGGGGGGSSSSEVAVVVVVV